MSPERRRNLAVSVRQRLLNLAHEGGEDFKYLLTRYANERLLLRLAESDHRGQSVLKDAALFEFWHDAPHRATRTSSSPILRFLDPADLLVHWKAQQGPQRMNAEPISLDRVA